MSNKTKTVNPIENINEVAKQAGVILMTAAATVGMVAPDHFKNRVATVPGQPIFASVENDQNGDQNNTLRREREETGPHYISYSVTQRTPGRTGKA